MNQRINTKGFTLVELLVVIAIIGVLSVVAIIVLGNAREMERDAIRFSDLSVLQSKLELHFIDNNAYPIAEEPVVLGGGSTGCLNVDGFQPRGCSDAYMPIVPADPGNSAYFYQSEDGSTYQIVATIEGEVNGLSGQVQVTPAGIR